MAQKTFTDEILTASDVNTYLMGEGGAWTTFTPTYADLTIGNGVVDAKFARYGRTIHFSINILFGSTTSVTGNIVILGLPVAMRAAEYSGGFRGSARDGSAAVYSSIHARANSTTAFGLQADASIVNATVPFEWASGDRLFMSGTYEGAS